MKKECFSHWFTTNPMRCEDCPDEKACAEAEQDAGRVILINEKMEIIGEKDQSDIGGRR